MTPDSQKSAGNQAARRLDTPYWLTEQRLAETAVPHALSSVAIDLDYGRMSSARIEITEALDEIREGRRRDISAFNRMVDLKLPPVWKIEEALHQVRDQAIPAYILKATGYNATKAHNGAWHTADNSMVVYINDVWAVLAEDGQFMEGYSLIQLIVHLTRESSDVVALKLARRFGLAVRNA